MHHILTVSTQNLFQARRFCVQKRTLKLDRESTVLISRLVERHVGDS